MTPGPRFLVFQTAFIGDVVLTLPLVQALKKEYPDATTYLVAVPSAAGVAENHPAIERVIVYDKRGAARGLRGFLALVRTVRSLAVDIAVVPHRSLRSALAVRLARIPQRIGFSTSAGRFLFTDIVPYNPDLHETERNLSLLGPLGVGVRSGLLPDVFPSNRDRGCVDALLDEQRERVPGFGAGRLVALAPGSVWMTKRWPEESFAALANALADEGSDCVLVGGSGDVPLCERIARPAGGGRILNVAGRLTLLQSAELMRRCRVVVSNDSAPMHLAVAVRTPVVAIYGATIPGFGFAPSGARDRVMETTGLPCRPCAIHGGPSCPIGTLECLRRITHHQVLSIVREYLV